MKEHATQEGTMRKVILSVGGGLVCLAALAAPATAQENSWAGKTVLTKKNDLTFGYSDDNGRQKILGTLTFVDYRVLADQGGWLKVSQNGVEGWFDKTQAIVLDEAPAYFTARIRENPSADLYNRRAIA